MSQRYSDIIACISQVETGESVSKAAVRELHEEAGIIATDIMKRGVIDYHMMDTDNKVQIHIFKATQYDGEVKERYVMKFYIGLRVGLCSIFYQSNYYTDYTGYENH